MGSLIKDNIINDINKCVKDYGIVIWYDPDVVYKSLVNNNNFKNVSIIVFKGSYYEIRFEVEKYFNEIDKKDLLIYIDRKRDTKNFPLIELEAPACICSPEPKSDFNTNLSVVVKKALSGNVKPQLIKNICEKVVEKVITIDEIEKLVESDTGLGILSTVFGSSNPQDITMLFICNGELDKEIEAKNIFNELTGFFERYLEINLSDIKDLPGLRKKIGEIIILVDFLETIRNEELLERYKNLNLPLGKDAVLKIREIANKWRKDSELSNSYMSVSKIIQDKYAIANESLDVEEIIDSETFQLTEDQILKYVLKNIGKFNLDKTKEIILKRKKLYWSKNIPEHNLIWQILEYYTRMLTQIKNADKKMLEKEWDLEDLIYLYAGKNNSPGWFLVDRYFRLIESKYSELDFGEDFEDEIYFLMSDCRNKYSIFLDNQIKNIILKLKGKPNFGKYKILNQRDIYRKKVLPWIESNKKCAYFLIDALRYEMGEDIIHLLEDSKKEEISPALSIIPTSTPFGMISLISKPDEEINMELADEKLALTINGIKINNRNDRLKYLKQRDSFVDEILKLDQIIKPKKSIRDKLKKMSFVLITSQEIDSLMETGYDDLAKNVMNEIFIQIKRAINTLSELGFKVFILSADHGYLLGSGIGKEHKVDVPDGKTYDLHKRYWIGKGGNNPENTVRFKTTDFGYDTDLDIIFPAGLSVLKTTGQENDYFHGGISLQELIIPVIEIHKEPKEKKKTSSDREYKIVFNKVIITNRIFLIKISEEEKQLTLENESNERKKKVSLKVISEGKDVGQVIAAEYGFIDSTKEIILELNKSNAVTIKLNEELVNGFLNIILIDSETELELVKIGELEFKLSI